MFTKHDLGIGRSSEVSYDLSDAQTTTTKIQCTPRRHRTNIEISETMERGELSFPGMVRNDIGMDSWGTLATQGLSCF